MRLAILSSPRCPVVIGAWQNGADPKALPTLLADRIADGATFPGEHVVRLPRRFSRMHLYQVDLELGRSG